MKICSKYVAHFLYHVEICYTAQHGNVSIAHGAKDTKRPMYIFFIVIIWKFVHWLWNVNWIQKHDSIRWILQFSTPTNHNPILSLVYKIGTDKYSLQHYVINSYCVRDNIFLRVEFTKILLHSWISIVHLFARLKEGKS